MNRAQHDRMRRDLLDRINEIDRAIVREREAIFHLEQKIARLEQTRLALRKDLTNLVTR